MSQQYPTSNQSTSARAGQREKERRTHRRRAAQLVARAWSDEQFKNKLLSDPASTFAEYALPVPAGSKLRVVENPPGVTTFVLPARPAEVNHVVLDRLCSQLLDGQGDSPADCGGGDCEHCRHCGGCDHCRHCGGCGDCDHCRHCGGCGDCDCGSCEGGGVGNEMGSQA
jgi:hypothetical protein